MPPEIKAKIDEIMAKTERDPDGKTRERILERLQRIRDLSGQLGIVAIRTAHCAPKGKRRAAEHSVTPNAHPRRPVKAAVTVADVPVTTILRTLSRQGVSRLAR